MLGAALLLALPGNYPVCSAATPGTSAQTQQKLTFDITPQALSSALNAFARISGLQVSYPSALSSGMNSAGVSGTFTIDQALTRLLAGSGLSYRYTGSDTTTLEHRDAVQASVKSATEPAQEAKVRPQAIKTLPVITVEETASVESLGSRSLEEARENLRLLPGGATLLGTATIRERALRSSQDALNFAPGVVVRTGQGEEDAVSIRGFGVLENSLTSSVRLLRDGQSLSRASGFGDTQDFNLFDASYIEVYKGASALQYGVSTLGGAINIVTPTGYDADPYRARLELGSFGYVRSHLSAAKVFGSGFDYYASLSTTDQNSFREHGAEHTRRGFANLGYRWNDRNESRLQLTLLESNQEDAGGLRINMLRDNPRQAQTAEFEGFSLNFPRFDSAINSRLYRLDLHHTLRVSDQDRLDFGIFHQGIKFDVPTPFGFFGGEYCVVSMKAVWPTTKTASSGVSIWRIRTVIIPDSPSATAASAGADRVYNDFSPRLGFTWQTRPAVQLFGNVSRSFEAPNSTTLIDSTIPADSDLRKTTKAQHATTLELGTRGTLAQFNYELALYHSWVTDEILITGIPPNLSSTNADESRHSGVELGVNGDLPLGVLAAGDKLHLNFSYTYNRSRFDDDRTFGDNQLVGIPEQFGRLELLYKHPSGFYIGPTLQAASGIFADFRNVLKSSGYAAAGLRAGYENCHGLTLFVEGSNLNDQHYANSVFALADATDFKAPRFRPGQTRAVFAGVEYRFE